MYIKEMLENNETYFAQPEFSCDNAVGTAAVSYTHLSVNSGVKFIATVHGSSVEEVLKRRNIADLISNEIFQYGVLLGSGSRIGEVMEIKKIV